MGDEFIEGTHEPLISIQTFEKINQLNAFYSRSNLDEGLSTPYPLKGFITCNNCGKKWTTYRNNKKGID